MKIYITGTSRGIGLSLRNNLIDHSVIATERSGGHDIEKDYDFVLDSILKSDVDIFINNAYTPEYQTKLLNDVYRSWKKLDKQIINIGSCASDMNINNSMRREEYPRNKIEQEQIIKDINLEYCSTGFKNETKCRVTNVKMGYVKTEFPSLLDKRKFPNLDPKYVVDVINWIITQPKTVCIREISLHSTEEPELW